MPKKLKLEFHPNLEKILDKINKKPLLRKFENLRQRIYQADHIARIQYPQEIKKYESAINDVNNLQPIFSFHNFQTPPDITNIIDNYHYNLRRVIELFQLILNSLSPFLKKKGNSKSKPISTKFKQFIKDIVDGKYDDYESSTVKFIIENFDFFCEIRWLRNKLKDDPRGNLIFRSGKGFLLIVKGNIKDDSEIKYANIKNTDDKGNFHCTINLDQIMNEHMKWFIEAFKAFVNNLAKEINDQLPKSEKIRVEK